MATEYGVMQITETGEEFCVFTGSESEVMDWLDENEGQYPESKFYVTAL